jgi:hypothetical protein
MHKGIEAAQRKQAELREAGELATPEHNWIKRANKNPGSLKTAIGAFCFHCFGGTEDHLPDPGWKEYIRTCTDIKCPLYPHRPYKVATPTNSLRESYNLDD